MSWSVAGWTPVQGPGRLWGGMRNQVELVFVNGVVPVFEFSCMFTACPANRGSMPLHICVQNSDTYLQLQSERFDLLMSKKNCVMHKCMLDTFHKVHFYRHYYHNQL